MTTPNVSRTSVRTHSTKSKLARVLGFERLEDRTVPTLLSLLPPTGLPDLPVDPAAAQNDLDVPAEPGPATPGYTKTEVMVRFASPAGLADLAAAAAADPGLAALIDVSASTVLIPGQSGAVYTVVLRAGADPLAAVAALEAVPGVEWASPNFVYSRVTLGFDPQDYTPNDPQYPSQYHHTKMQNNKAWDGPPTPFFGTSNIIVAVTDDGLDIDHQDISAGVWVNDDPVNGSDDDGNGYIDDLNGWDFINNENNPRPNSTSNSHGTHVAGIAAARTNNNVGVAGTAGGVTIMPLQFYSLELGYTSAIVAAAYRYAADNGAKIVSTSYNVDSFVSDPTFLAGLNVTVHGGSRISVAPVSLPAA